MRGEAEQFLTTFELFRNRKKTFFYKRLQWLLNFISILRENQKKVGLIYVNYSFDFKPFSTVLSFVLVYAGLVMNY